MGLLRKITLSRKLSAVLGLISVIYLVYRLSHSFCLSFFFLDIFLFITGALAVYPIIYSSWLDLKLNWDRKVEDTGKTYRDFFSGNLKPKTREKLVRHHWKKVQWIVPYAFLVNFPLTFIAVFLFSLSQAFVLFSGGLFGISVVSYRYQSKLEL